MLLGQLDHLGVNVMGIDVSPAQRCPRVLLIDPDARHAKIMLTGLQPQTLGLGDVGDEVVDMLNAAYLGFGQVNQVRHRGQRLRIPTLRRGCFDSRPHPFTPGNQPLVLQLGNGRPHRMSAHVIQLAQLEFRWQQRPDRVAPAGNALHQVFCNDRIARLVHTFHQSRAFTELTVYQRARKNYVRTY
ncbi:hypothetical protein D3C85_994180 [compost metagenome]